MSTCESVWCSRVAQFSASPLPSLCRLLVKSCAFFLFGSFQALMSLDILVGENTGEGNESSKKREEEKERDEGREQRTICLGGGEV